jgi:hypothetical protein
MFGVLTRSVPISPVKSFSGGAPGGSAATFAGPLLAAGAAADSDGIIGFNFKFKFGEIFPGRAIPPFEDAAPVALTLIAAGSEPAPDPPILS